MGSYDFNAYQKRLGVQDVYVLLRHNPLAEYLDVARFRAPL